MTTNWKGSLGHIAERLRRSIAWTSAGTLDVQFENPVIPIQPVIISDDATRPGTAGVNSPRNRRWMYGQAFEDVLLGDKSWSFLITEGYLTGSSTQSNGVIVDQIHISTEVQSTWQIGIIPPGGALPAAVVSAIVANQRGPIFVDGMRSITDWAPLWQASTLDDPGDPWGGIPVYSIAHGNQAGDTLGEPFVIPTEIYLQPGSVLFVGPGDAELDEQDWQVSYFGRAF